MSIKHIVALKSLAISVLTLGAVSFNASAQEPVDYEDVLEVDLGLSVNWAAWNIGANSPDEYGMYFPWGETRERKTYESANCRAFDKDEEWLESEGYIQWCNSHPGDQSGILTSAHDAAQTLWGDGWRMPSVKELRELHNKCEIEPYNINGVEGWLFISKVPGYTDRSIFIPAAGYKGATEEDFNEGYPKDEIIDEAETVYFWTRDYFPTDDVTGRDWRINRNGSGEWLDEYRFYGFTIRPVKDKQK